MPLTSTQQRMPPSATHLTEKSGQSLHVTRYLSYQRGLSNYKLSISLLAWLLMVISGTRALDILLTLDDVAVSFGELGISLLLCVLVCRAKGNVATLLRGYS